MELVYKFLYEHISIIHIYIIHTHMLSGHLTFSTIINFAHLVNIVSLITINRIF